MKPSGSSPGHALPHPGIAALSPDEGEEEMVVMEKKWVVRVGLSAEAASTGSAGTGGWAGCREDCGLEVSQAAPEVAGSLAAQ